MRINKFIADNTTLSRRKADEAIKNGRIMINGDIALLGDSMKEFDNVTFDGKKIYSTATKTVTVLLNKPVGYVCSKDGQGSKTVYDLLPEEYQGLNIAGRLDKDSSGLVVLTNNGELLNELTHPSFNKEKIYEVEIDRELNEAEITGFKKGIDIGDSRPSKFKKIEKIGPKKYKIILEEGRNRQIRRSFEALNVKVKKLHRVQLGEYKIEDTKDTNFEIIQ